MVPTGMVNILIGCLDKISDKGYSSGSLDTYRTVWDIIVGHILRGSRIILLTELEGISEGEIPTGRQLF